MNFKVIAIKPTTKLGMTQIIEEDVTSAFGAPLRRITSKFGENHPLRNSYGVTQVSITKFPNRNSYDIWWNSIINESHIFNWFDLSNYELTGIFEIIKKYGNKPNS